MNNLIFDKFVIISMVEQKGLELKFERGINFILGKNKTGKSCISKSLFYTLGCDVYFEDSWIRLDNKYILFFTYNNLDYTLIRYSLKKGKGKNYFILINKEKDEINKFFSTAELAEYFSDFFNFDIRLINRSTDELSNIYPNHIFLPFYVDQDTSWGNLFTDTFNNLNFLSDFRQSIIEYFVGYRSNLYYRKLAEKKYLENDLHENEQLLKSNMKILEKNYDKITQVEDIDIDLFKEELKTILLQFEDLLKQENQIKQSLGKLINEKLYLQNHKNNIENTINTLEKHELNKSCPYCTQKIYNDTLKKYNIYTAEDELTKQLNVNEMTIKQINNQINEESNKLENLKGLIIEQEKIIAYNNYKINLAELIINQGLKSINSSIKEEIKNIKSKIDEISEKLLSTKETLLSLEKNDSIARDFIKDIALAYKKLSIPVKYRRTTNSPFLSIRGDYSGTDKIKSYIAYYLVIYQYIYKNEEIVKMPFVLDTPFRDDFDKDNEKKILSFIEDTIMNENETEKQIIVSSTESDSISDYLKEHDYNTIRLEGERKLLNQDYSQLYAKYHQLLKL